MAASVNKAKDVLHIKLLYSLIVLLLVAFAAGFFWSYKEIQRLRNEIERKLVRQEMVDFRVYNNSHPAAFRDTQLKADVENRTFLPNSDDEFESVRRRIKRQTSSRDDSGTDDWVWLSSYSRIPVSPQKKKQPQQKKRRKCRC